jgi:YspA, cpYpsA-related SLOG family
MQVIGKPIRLAVVGTRTYTNKQRVYFELDELRKLYRLVEIISGIAQDDEKTRGVDSFARDYARDHKIPYKGFPADWKDMAPPVLRRMGQYGEYNALAGSNRNTKIADYAECCLAFWDWESTGTADTISKFKALDKKVKIVKI